MVKIEAFAVEQVCYGLPCALTTPQLICENEMSSGWMSMKQQQRTT